MQFLLLVIDPNLWKLIRLILGSLIDLFPEQESLTMLGLVFGADGCEWSLMVVNDTNCH